MEVSPCGKAVHHSDVVPTLVTVGAERRPVSDAQRPDATDALTAVLRQRILVIDGAMGTLIQDHGLGEADYRGSQFADHGHDLRGDSDILSLTQPDIIREIHRRYLQAGADVVCTNSFTASSVSQADYGLQDHCYEVNSSAAALAREAADDVATEDWPRFVALSLIHI